MLIGMDTTFERISGFQVGQKVKHRLRGQHGGNGTTIPHSHGTITEIKYVGDDYQGCAVFFATVQWDKPEEWDVDYLGTRGLEQA